MPIMSWMRNSMKTSMKNSAMPGNATRDEKILGGRCTRGGRGAPV